MLTKAHGRTVTKLSMSRIIAALLAVEDGGADAELDDGFIVKVVDVDFLKTIDDGKTAVVDVAWVRV